MYYNDRVLTLPLQIPLQPSCDILYPSTRQTTHPSVHFVIVTKDSVNTLHPTIPNHYYVPFPLLFAYVLLHHCTVCSLLTNLSCLVLFQTGSKNLKPVMQVKRLRPPLLTPLPPPSSPLLSLTLRFSQSRGTLSPPDEPQCL